MTDLGGLLRVLASADVEFIMVGGVAAMAHGSARLTQDLDVVYRRTPDNIERLAAAHGLRIFQRGQVIQAIFLNGYFG